MVVDYTGISADGKLKAYIICGARRFCAGRGKRNMQIRNVFIFLAALAVSACAGSAPAPSATPAPTVILANTTPTSEPDGIVYQIDTANSTTSYLATGPFSSPLPGNFKALG